MAALTAALNELAVQCTGKNVPKELHTLFPNWDAEFPRTARRGATELRLACSRLEEAERVAKLEADPDHTNLSWPIPNFVHDVLHACFAAELPFSRRFDWPAGHSIAALARRS